MENRSLCGIQTRFGVFVPFLRLLLFLLFSIFLLLISVLAFCGYILCCLRDILTFYHFSLWLWLFWVISGCFCWLFVVTWFCFWLPGARSWLFFVGCLLYWLFLFLSVSFWSCNFSLCFWVVCSLFLCVCMLSVFWWYHFLCSWLCHFWLI